MKTLTEKLSLNKQTQIYDGETLNEKYCMFTINGQNSMCRKTAVLYFLSIFNKKVRKIPNEYNPDWMFVCDKKYEKELKEALKETLKETNNEVEIYFIKIIDNEYYNSINSLAHAIKTNIDFNYMKHLQFILFRG